jgi:hypothetical protein
LRLEPPAFRADDRPRFDAPFLALPFRDDFREADFRLPELLRADLRDADFRPDDRLRAPPDFPADFRVPPLLFRPPLRDDFFLDAMNWLLVKWWCPVA